MRSCGESTCVFKRSQRTPCTGSVGKSSLFGTHFDLAFQSPFFLGLLSVTTSFCASVSSSAPPPLVESSLAHFDKVFLRAAIAW